MENINIKMKKFNFKIIFLFFIFLSFTVSVLSDDKSKKIYFDGYKYTNLPPGKQVLKNKKNNPQATKNIKTTTTQKKYIYAKFFSSPEEEKIFRQQFLQYYQQVGKNYENAIKSFNKKINDKLVKDIARSVIFYTMLFNRNEKIPLDPRLVLAIIKCESDFNPQSVSPSGALGLGQLMPFTAASVGLNKSYSFHPIYNIYGTVRILRAYFNRWAGLPYSKQYLFAIASYNAGPNAVAKYGGIPPYKETINYVYKVTAVYKALAPEYFEE